MSILALNVIAIAALQSAISHEKGAYCLRAEKRIGVSRIYESELNINFALFTIEKKSKSSFKVIKLNPDCSYDLQESFLSGHSKVNDLETELGFTGTQIHRFNKEGVLIPLDSDENSSFNSIFAFAIHGFPVDYMVTAGQQWGDTIAGNGTKFKFYGPERLSEVETLRLDCETNLKTVELDGIAKFTFWLRANDSSLERMEMTVEDVRITGFEYVGKMSLSVRRVSKI